jgi:hypothetical protein
VGGALPQTQSRLTVPCESIDNRFDERALRLCRLISCAITGLFRLRAAFQAEILMLRHRVNVTRRESPKRATVGSTDRLVLVGLYRLSSSWTR